MLRPDIQWKNPVMFVVEIGAFLTLFYLLQAALGKSESQVSTGDMGFRNSLYSNDVSPSNNSVSFTRRVFRVSTAFLS